MADKDVLRMLHDEIMKKVDENTAKRLKDARTKEEGLAILEEASIKLDDDLLASVPGGDTSQLEDMMVGYCVWHWCSDNCRQHFFCPANT